MNLLHVVSRGSLHVAFLSSSLLPENRNPAATRYVPRHTWQNGRVNVRGGERTRERENGRDEGGEEAMMP